MKPRLERSLAEGIYHGSGRSLGNSGSGREAGNPAAEWGTIQEVYLKIEHPNYAPAFKSVRLSDRKPIPLSRRSDHRPSRH